MATLLIILCPPRSFSSVVAAMIGQHPELYGFPELQLFSDESMDTLLIRREKRAKRRPLGWPDSSRRKSSGFKTRAQPFKRSIDPRTPLLEHQADARLRHPSRGPEDRGGKITRISSRFSYMERAARDYPDAYFLHLTRHPVSARQGIEEFFGSKTERARRHGSEAVAKEKPCSARPSTV